jgi:hypothetical protein
MQIEISTALGLLEMATSDAGRELVQAIAAEVDRLQTVEKLAREYLSGSNNTAEVRGRLCRVLDISEDRIDNGNDGAHDG